MSPKLQTKISKRLSLVLRHQPESIGIALDPQGWVNTQTLLEALSRHGTTITAEELEIIVRENPKQRFEFNDSGSHIRARQGHSVKVDLDYPATTPPDKLYHGTPERFLKSIFTEGLTKQQRHHVHLSTSIPTMLEVARRRGRPVLLEINALQMHQNGHEFFITDNEVWLTEFVPAKYLKQIKV